MRVFSIAKKDKIVISPGVMIILILILIFSSFSCTETNEFTIGDDFTESQTSIKILDTFKIDVSTVLLDSLQTSGTGVTFVGSYKDEEIGKISSKSFFELAIPSAVDIAESAIYDSAVFVFSYSGISYGDTTLLMSLNIHQITERIVLNSSTEYLYNTSIIPHSSKILGTKLFFPEPSSGDTLITIAVNEFGETLFDLMKEKDEVFSSSELFLDYIKGFALTSDATASNSIIGLTADEDHLFLNIYYHNNTQFPESSVIKIPFGNSSHQFNNIQYDFSGTSLYDIKNNKNIVSSEETGNIAYLQGLIGLLPKIQFPTLGNILYENRWKILKAELIIAPVKTSYDDLNLPDNLYLYETDKHNKINSVLSNAAGDQLVSSLYLDELFKEDTNYTFNITPFILSEVSDSFVDYEHGILIGLRGTDLITTFGRMLLECKNPSVKLRLHYLTY